MKIQEFWKSKNVGNLKILKIKQFLAIFGCRTLCLLPPARPLKGAFGRRLLRRIEEKRILSSLRSTISAAANSASARSWVFDWTTLAARLASLSLTAVQSNTKKVITHETKRDHGKMVPIHLNSVLTWNNMNNGKKFLRILKVDKQKFGGSRVQNFAYFTRLNPSGFGKD